MPDGKLPPVKLNDQDIVAPKPSDDEKVWTAEIKVEKMASGKLKKGQQYVKGTLLLTEDVDDKPEIRNNIRNIFPLYPLPLLRF